MDHDHKELDHDHEHQTLYHEHPTHLDHEMELAIYRHQQLNRQNQ
uniref:Uncharacterized protein n=1 Tax=Picea glauca TaxID=3330 RepID=A0A101LUN2_PICGL|nr:hypothetical protein ABT39_MTgene2489 [Picea glauca]KUM45668.1 hypothetical protein ABT39_MTgene2504 [Picea glauca]KUM45679.1 hypothetical protein ABT39_MTgene2515 [Picea glauca]